MTGTPVNAEQLGKLTWATPAADLPDADAVPLDDLLQALQLLASDDARQEATKAGNKWDSPTPASMQVIKSGALDITKNGTKLVKNAGGSAGLIAAVAGVITAFMDKVGEAVTVTLLGGSAVLLGAVAIALALFVKGDVEARGVATAARHHGRAEVAAAFLQATAAMPTKKAPASAAQPSGLTADFMLALSAFPRHMKVTTEKYQTPTAVSAVARGHDAKPLELLLANNDWVLLSEITGFTTAPD